MRVVTPLGQYIFEFDTEDDATSVSTHLAALRAPAAAPAAPATSTPQPSHQQAPRPGELPQALKEQLLKDNADLRTMYEALVRRGLLSEAEFWGGQREVANRQQQTQQRPGMSNIITSILSAVADGKQNQVNYTLTRQQINAILAESPAVRRSYLANVPHNLSEEQFWQYYCKHQFALHEKRQRRLQGKRAHDIDDEHAALFTEHHSEEDAHVARAKAARVAPEVNLAVDEADQYAVGHAAGSGEARPGHARIAQELYAAQDVVQQYNLHAEAALQGALAAVDASASTQLLASALAKRERQEVKLAAKQSKQQQQQQQQQDAVLEDLLPSPSPHFQQLNIADPRRYFQHMGQAGSAGLHHSVGAGPAMGDVTVYDSIEMLQRSAVESGERMQLQLQPDTMEQALLSLTAPKLADASDGGTVLQRPIAMALPSSQQELMRGILLALNELMRHLWGALPVTNQARAAKAERLVKELQRHEASLSAKLSDPGAFPPEQRPYMRMLMRSMLASLDRALQEYDRDCARRRQGARRAAA